MIATSSPTAQMSATVRRARAPRLLYATTISGSLWGFMHPFAHHFRNLGWTVDGMARGASDCVNCLSTFDRVWEAPWSRNPLDPKNLLVAAREIRKVVEAGSYDIVHVHTPVAAFVTRYALRRRNAQNHPKVIYTAHGFHFHPYGRPLQNAIFKTLERLAGRWTDHLVTINHADEEAAISSRIVPGAQVQYIPGIGIDTEQYSPVHVSEAEIARVRAEIGIPAGRAMLLMLAEFNPGKRHADALHAAATAGRQDFHIAFAGYGRTYEEIRALAVKLGIAGRVHFLGMRRDVPVLIRASAAVLLPSEREGLSRSVMEALSLETPVIGTKIRGIYDLVGDDAGLLVSPGDRAGLSIAISWLLDHPKEARRMGRIGRERMKQFDVRHVIRAHEDLYTKALEGSCLPV
jgi:glycosyltransferase involved in cell wall biosynthesis